MEKLLNNYGKKRIAKVYGMKDGAEKLLFHAIEINTLARRGMDTARKNGYTVSRIIALAAHNNGYKETDITKQFLDELKEG